MYIERERRLAPIKSLAEIKKTCLMVTDCQVSSYSYKIDRYSLDKKYVSTGRFMVVEKGAFTQIFYEDGEVNESESDTAHPMMALLRLRTKLETKFNSIIACNGCRIDTTLRVTGIDTANVIREGNIHQDDWVAIFEPTNEVAKLCTVKEHEQAYEEWCETWGPNS